MIPILLGNRTGAVTLLGAVGAITCCIILARALVNRRVAISNAYLLRKALLGAPSTFALFSPSSNNHVPPAATPLTSSSSAFVGDAPFGSSSSISGAHTGRNLLHPRLMLVCLASSPRDGWATRCPLCRMCRERDYSLCLSHLRAHVSTTACSTMYGTLVH